ncbi:MAG: pyrH [Candidatus Saccharibacteria bacterium]|nr:pyrH [Candidatus Saccharibacteria bacterium]
MKTAYQRILLKLSGEQLAGKYEVGIDPEVAGFFANEIKRVLSSDCQVAIVVGGGNMVRGAEVAGQGIRRVTGDQMGMLSGLINSMAITDIFEAHQIATRCLSNIFADQVAEAYSYRRAIKHLEHDRVVIIAGGIGRPYFTHDTAAVNLALELSCDVMIKATKVDAVYDKDPKKHTDAVKITNLPYQQAVQDEAIKIMDKAALGLAMEQHMPVIIYDAMKPGNTLKVVQGEPVGTTIK